jgi:hypothetical protein
VRGAYEVQVTTKNSNVTGLLEGNDATILRLHAQILNHFIVAHQFANAIEAK